MKNNRQFDVIIIGGSYSGLAAGMALGRALRKVLIIDSGEPCNRQTPYSHNFITHDGEEPAEIAAYAKEQVKRYRTVKFLKGLATNGRKVDYGFEILTESGDTFRAKKLIFATGIKDLLHDIDGIESCWGISVLHCPYCHGYEVKNGKTGILANGEFGYDFTRLISNWSSDLTLLTNGPSTLSDEQKGKLQKRGIAIIENEIASLKHTSGHIKNILFRDGTKIPIKAIYAPMPFEQKCKIPESLGCELTEDGYLKIDALQETVVRGVFACGDNTTRTRTIANAVALGTTAGMTSSKKMILEEF